MVSPHVTMSVCVYVFHPYRQNVKNSQRELCKDRLLKNSHRGAPYGQIVRVILKGAPYGQFCKNILRSALYRQSVIFSICYV